MNACLSFALVISSIGCQKPSLDHDPKLDVHVGVLENGLRVVLAERHASPVVSVWTGYRVGSKDEQMHETGLAHFLEHMMFKGTPTLPKGAIDLATQTHGGVNNAFTSNDVTIYFFDFPAEHLDVALKIEADRMRNCLLDFKEFEAEKAVVVQEIGMNDDNPSSRLSREAEALAFLVHPYHHPVLGWQQEIERLKAEDMKAFYNKFYQPNNATLVVAGDFDAKKTFARVAELFGKIKRGPEPSRSSRVEPEKKGQRRSELVEPVNVPRLLMGFRTVRTLDPEEHALDCLSRVLGSGKSSRLYKRLVMQDKVATSVSTSNDTRVHPGLFWIEVEGIEDVDTGEIEAALFDEIEKLTDDVVEPRELERAKNGIIAGRVFTRETAAGVGQELVSVEATASLDYLRDYEEKLLAVTADQVRAVCKRFLREERATIVWSLPDEGDDAAGAGVNQPPGAKDQAARSNELSCNEPSIRNSAPEAAPAGQARRTAAPKLNVLEKKLPNGLTLLLMEKHDQPVFALAAYVNAGQRYEPIPGVANLTGRMLETGAGDRSEEEIAETIEFVGGSLDASGSGASAHTLAKDAALAIELVSDVLMRPTFPAEVLERERTAVLAEIAAELDEPTKVAADAFRKVIYGDHPFARDAKGTRETVAAITRDDLIAFHRKFFVPNNTVVCAVGDFQADAMAEAITKRLGGWKKQPLELPAITPPALAEKRGEVVIEQDRAQVNVFVGHLGITRKDPDYVTLKVMDNIFGVSPGFTDRLSSYIRDELGLCYTVSGSVSGSAGEEPGTFRTFVGTKPDQWRRAHAEIIKQIERIIAEPVSDDELARAKVYLTGSYVFGFQRASDIAHVILELHRHKLGFDYPQRYLDAVQTVTAEQILAAAKKHLHPKRLTTVAVGKVSAASAP